MQYLLQTESPKLRDENVAACTAGYHAVEAQLSEAA
jgi:hypothetical protein